jgi:hypothetical protein
MAERRDAASRRSNSSIGSSPDLDPMLRLVGRFLFNEPLDHDRAFHPWVGQRVAELGP